MNAVSIRTSRPLVMIPTYNEADGIRAIVDEILATSPAIHILIIDDSSPDGTGKIITDHPEYHHRIHLHSRPKKLGLGTAYREGYHWGLRHDYTCFIQIDADHSHDPADIPRLLEAVENGADLALGSRYVHGVRVLNWALERMMLSIFAGAYTRVLTALPFTDPTSGFKAVHRSAIEKLHWEKFTSGGYSFQIELHFYLLQSGAVCKEVPIIFTERRGGESKMSREIALEAALRVLRLSAERFGL